MDWNDRPRTVGYRGLELRRIEVVKLGIYVDQHWVHTVVQHDIGRRDERYGWNDDLIAVAPAMSLLRSLQRNLERTRPAVAHDPEPTSVQARKFRLQFLGHGPV